MNFLSALTGPTDWILRYIKHTFTFPSGIYSIFVLNMEPVIITIIQPLIETVAGVHEWMLQRLPFASES